MRRRRSIAGLVSVLALAGAACGTTPESHEARGLDVTGTPLVLRDTVVPLVLDASGTAEPIQRAEVATKLPARVLEVRVREGDRVTAGQVLVRVDGRDVAARREQVNANLAGATAAHTEALAGATRIRALYADSAAPRATLDAAEAGLARAEAAVRAARAAGAEVDAMGDYATLRAPFAGVVTRRMADPGSFAGPGMPLVVVEDPSRLRLSVTAAPEAVAAVRAGMRLAGTVAGQPVEAVVEGLAPAPGGHLVTVNALVANRGGAAFPGSAATLALPQGERRAILLPDAALVREGDLTGVYLRKGGVTDLRWVRLGRRAGGHAEVVAGLAPGDTVIVASGPATPATGAR